MFFHLISDVNDDFSLNESNEFTELEKVTDKLRTEYEEAGVTLDETIKRKIEAEEQLSLIESDRIKLMSELTQQMQLQHDTEKKLEELKNVLKSYEFDFKKYNKMKLSTDDLETFTRVKKTFATYKKMLKVYFDYSNGANTITQKGYMYNTISKKLTYFDFNTNENTVNEISAKLWRKMMAISDKDWKNLDVEIIDLQ